MLMTGPHLMPARDKEHSVGWYAVGREWWQTPTVLFIDHNDGGPKPYRVCYPEFFGDTDTDLGVRFFDTRHEAAAFLYHILNKISDYKDADCGYINDLLDEIYHNTKTTVTKVIEGRC